MKPRLILLHGFTGSGRAFDHLRDGFSAVADVETPDMPFHQTGRCVNADLILDLDWSPVGGHAGPPLFTGGPMCPPDFSPILLGYSMGGRFAMREALANPDRVGLLILESTHPGIESELEREARRQRDATLATSLVEDYDRFLATWNRLPLFASPSDAPSKPREHFEAIQRAQVPSRMARSLIEHGAGTMMPVRDRLHTLPMPVLAITGALDRTYTELWAGIVSEAPNIRHVIIPNAGHRVHLDRPEAYLSTVLSFIQEHIPS